MKKAIFSILLLTCSFWGTKASAQVAVSVKIGCPVYAPSPPPVRVVVSASPSPGVKVVRPAPVVVRPVVPPPVYIVARPKRKVVVYR